MRERVEREEICVSVYLVWRKGRDEENVERREEEGANMWKKLRETRRGRSYEKN